MIKLNKKLIVGVLTAILGLAGLLLKAAQQLPDEAPAADAGAPAVVSVPTAADAGVSDAGDAGK